jgi:hypothetical protein
LSLVRSKVTPQSLKHLFNRCISPIRTPSPRFLTRTSSVPAAG